jgi:spoIIIJ-associated protein
MNKAEGAGRTVEGALQAALDALNATREEVKIEVLQEPRPAILGFGGREARVRVTRLESAGVVARDVASEILSRMGYEVKADLRDETADAASIVLSGPDLSGLIGRRGRTLDALELIVSMHVLRRRGAKIALTIDAGGYRARREKALIDMAREAGERVVREGRPVALDPMEAKERRIIHLALRDDPRVMTASQGEEGERFVVVSPAAPGRSPVGQSETSAVEEPGHRSA